MVREYICFDSGRNNKGPHGSASGRPRFRTEQEARKEENKKELRAGFDTAGRLVEKT